MTFDHTTFDLAKITANRLKIIKHPTMSCNLVIVQVRLRGEGGHNC